MWRSNALCVPTLVLSLALIVVSGADAFAATDYYAAVAFSSSTGAYGYCTGHALTQSEAENHALANCKASDPHLCGWTKNAWLALAKGDKVGAHGWAWSDNEQTAGARALEECGKHTGGCYIVFCLHAAGAHRFEKPTAPRETASDNSPTAPDPEPEPIVRHWSAQRIESELGDLPKSASAVTIVSDTFEL